MANVSTKHFVALVQSALAQSGRLSSAELAALTAAQKAITTAPQRAAAESLLALVRHDRELDDFEIDPAREALAILTGVTHGPLPADLERALTHAVPQANVDVKQYDLSFDLSGNGPSFPGRAVISLQAPATADTVLELNPDRLALRQVLADGRPVAFHVVDGRLHVAAAGARSLQIDYSVKSVDSKSAEAFGLVKDKYTGRLWTMTWPYNTGALFPSNSAPSDGATAVVNVKVAPGFQAVTTSHGGDAQSPAYAIAFYASKDFQLGDAGHSHDGVAVTGFGAGHEVPQKIRAAYQATARDALDFYSGWLGRFDYGNSLRLVEVGGELGGMEHTSAVAIMLNSAKDADGSREVAAHETAHHWFGDNLRIADWGDFWMSEGFTNYATYRFFEHSEGPEKFHALLDGARDELAATLEANPHALAVPAYTDVNEIFDAVPYQLGPWMLRMMETTLGRPAFDGLLRDWYQTHRQQAVSTDQFVAFAKAKTGHDFAPFFQQWNSLTAVPTFDPTVSVKGSQVRAQLKASTPVPDGLQVPLLLEGAAGQRKTVMVDPAKALSIDAGFPVKRTEWDPERTVLALVRG